MATRSLTEVFILMRNNALRNRNSYAEHNLESSERMQLISLNDVEQGLENRNEVLLPPSWIDQLEEAQFAVTKLHTKINELKSLHSRSLHRPTFDESAEEEVLIDNCTADISSMFNTIHRLIQYIKSHSFDGTMKERQLTVNVVKSLATSLQELSTQFRSTQSTYLKQIQSREERSNVYFNNSALQEDCDVFADDDIDDYFVKSKQMTQQQLLYLEEENTRVAVQREQEVNAIVKSIIDLNDIFKDLSQMVADQGTVLDRIDYNIEQSQMQVFEGFKQLQKADAYQRKNRKMCAIIILATTTIFLFFLLVIIKT